MLLKDLVQHYITANSLHGTHSPFIYSFYKEVFDNDLQLDFYAKIEAQRSILKRNQSSIEFVDYGAKGSNSGMSKKKKVSSIAKKSLKKAKWGRALNRLVKYLKPKEVIELGTSLGITTSYMASGFDQSQVVTFDGSTQVLEESKQVWFNLGLENITTIEGNIDITLPSYLERKSAIEIVFVDANHQENATIKYFDQLYPLCSEKSVLIFDDIYWSLGMKKAWEYIKAHPSTFQTIDLFELGIVFFRRTQEKEHFKLKY